MARSTIQRDLGIELEMWLARIHERGDPFKKEKPIK